MQISCHNFAKIAPERDGRERFLGCIIYFESMLQRIITAGTERSLIYNRLEADFLGFLFGFAGFFLKLAVDSHVGILVETGVGFEAGFGLGTAFEDRIIMVQETRAPFECGKGVVMLECMSLALGFFDEFTVGYTGCGPVFREMVGV